MLARDAVRIELTKSEFDQPLNWGRARIAMPRVESAESPARAHGHGAS